MLKTFYFLQLLYCNPLSLIPIVSAFLVPTGSNSDNNKCCTHCSAPYMFVYCIVCVYTDYNYIKKTVPERH